MAVSGLVIPTHAMAQEQKKFVGMHHLEKPAPSPESPVAAAPVEELHSLSKEDEETKTPPSPQYKPLSIEETLVETKDLKQWPHLNQAATAYGAESLEKIVALIEADRGAVPSASFILYSTSAG